MKLLTHPHKDLSKPCPKYDMKYHKEDVLSAQDMVQVMTADHGKLTGVGIAAPQVGIRKRFFVMFPDYQTKSKIMYCFDPKILAHGRGISTMAESCLSVPGQSKSLDRWEIITVEYIDENGVKKMDTLKYWTARVFQHELDHLDGILCMFKRQALQ